MIFSFFEKYIILSSFAILWYTKYFFFQGGKMWNFSSESFHFKCINEETRTIHIYINIGSHFFHTFSHWAQFSGPNLAHHEFWSAMRDWLHQISQFLSHFCQQVWEIYTIGIAQTIPFLMAESERSRSWYQLS